MAAAGQLTAQEMRSASVKEHFVVCFGGHLIFCSYFELVHSLDSSSDLIQGLEDLISQLRT